MNRPSLETLTELLEYRPETGIFIWLVQPTRRTMAGEEAGSVNSIGYRYIKLDGYQYPAHRLAWLFISGDWPNGQIDHINGNRSDNGAINLRDVSLSGNSQNRRAPSTHNTSGYLGVRKKGTKFAACIKVGGKDSWLGTFTTAAEAGDAYLQAKRLMHTTCTI